MTSPPTTTRQRGAAALDVLDAQPDEPVVDQHVVARARARRRSTAGATGRSPSVRGSLADDRRPRRRSPAARGSARSPTRSFGPWRSAISASGRPSSACTSRTSRARAACSSCVAVREVEPRGVHARLDERADDLVRGGRRADRGDDLRASDALSTTPSPRPSDGRPRERATSRDTRPRVAELLLDAEQLVVLRDAVGARRARRS